MTELRKTIERQMDAERRAEQTKSSTEERLRRIEDKVNAVAILVAVSLVIMLFFR